MDYCQERSFFCAVTCPLHNLSLALIRKDRVVCLIVATKVIPGFPRRVTLQPPLDTHVFLFSSPDSPPSPPRPEHPRSFQGLEVRFCPPPWVVWKTKGRYEFDHTYSHLTFKTDKAVGQIICGHSHCPCPHCCLCENTCGPPSGLP